MPDFERMTTLQRRLHNAACVIGADGDEYGYEQLQRDAIAEIERLRNERDRLLFALRTIKAGAGNPEFVFTTARDVLAEFDSIIEQKR